jgi:hypothetical protein
LEATGEKGRLFSSRLNINMMDRAKWDEAADWLYKHSSDYEAALADAVG